MSVFKDFPGLENLEKKIQGLSRTHKSPVKQTGKNVTHCRIKVLSKLLEVRQCFAKVDIGVLTVEQDAQYRLSCTCVVDYLTKDMYYVAFTSHQSVNN